LKDSNAFIPFIVGELNSRPPIEEKAQDAVFGLRQILELLHYHLDRMMDSILRMMDVMEIQLNRFRRGHWYARFECMAHHAGSWHR